MQIKRHFKILMFTMKLNAYSSRWNIWNHVPPNICWRAITIIIYFLPADLSPFLVKLSIYHNPYAWSIEINVQKASHPRNSFPILHNTFWFISAENCRIYDNQIHKYVGNIMHVYWRCIPSPFKGNMCLDRALFIWNILIESTSKRARNDSSHIISRLLFGSCKLFSRI